MLLQGSAARVSKIGVLVIGHGVRMRIDNHETDGEECQRADNTEEREEREFPAPHAIHEPNADEGAHEVDGRDESRQPNRLGRVVEAGHLDNGGAVIHHRVNSRDLLEHLEQTAEEQGAQDRWSLKDLHQNERRLTFLFPVL